MLKKNLDGIDSPRHHPNGVASSGRVGIPKREMVEENGSGDIEFTPMDANG